MKHFARVNIKLSSCSGKWGGAVIYHLHKWRNGGIKYFFFNDFHLGNEAKERRRRKNGILAHKIDECIVLFSTNAEV